MDWLPSLIRKSICAVLACSIIHPSLALAQFSPPMNMPAAPAREYYVGRDLGRPLVTVHILGGVSTPGVYHIPQDTDLAALIAYAGGATERADLRGVTVRRSATGNYKIMDVDLEKALREPNDIFRLQDRDVIQIDQKFNAEKSLQWVGIISAIASVVLSFYLVEDIRRRQN